MARDLLITNSVYFAAVLERRGSLLVQPEEVEEPDHVLLDLPSRAFESKLSFLGSRSTYSLCLHRLSADGQIVQTAAKSLVSGDVNWIREGAGHRAHWSIRRPCQGKRTSTKRPAYRAVPSRFWPISPRSSVNGAYP